MPKLIEKMFHAWERRLAVQDDPEREVLPFEWGVDYLGDGTCPGPQARSFLRHHVRRALQASDVYFLPPDHDEFRLEANELRFTTPLPTRHEENNAAHGVLFPLRPRGPAVVVLPQWNAKGGAQDGLCRLINFYGMTALKLSLPYHGPRMPAGLVRADYMLSPNLGRTLHACRQAVLETRMAARWLRDEGYEPIGVLGTSLGSCIAFIAFAHDVHIAAGVFNHISPYFADVVWRGLSTRHIREGLQEAIDLEELRAVWLPISPQSYVHRLRGGSRRSLLVSARYDLSFPPDLSRLLFREFEVRKIAHETFILPCGHYTTGKLPWSLIDGLVMARFLNRNLRGATRPSPSRIRRSRWR